MSSKNASSASPLRSLWLVSSAYWVLVVLVVAVWIFKTNYRSEYSSSNIPQVQLEMFSTVAIDTPAIHQDSEQAVEETSLQHIDPFEKPRFHEPTDRPTEIIAVETPIIGSETTAIEHTEQVHQADTAEVAEQDSTKEIEEQLDGSGEFAGPSQKSNEPTAPTIHYPDAGIIAGKTAPHYVLEDRSSVDNLLKYHHGLFVITDGRVGYDIGGDINKPRRTPININEDASWDKIYAKRVALIPASWRYEQVAYKLSGIAFHPDQASIVLAIPERVDRLIFDAQSRFFNEELDVKSTTIIRVSPTQIQVLGIAE